MMMRLMFTTGSATESVIMTRTECATFRVEMMQVYGDAFVVLAYGAYHEPQSHDAIVDALWRSDIFGQWNN